MANRFKKGDQVIVITGSSKNKIGNVISIDADRVVVSGVNLATVHKKPTSEAPGRVEKVEKSIHISNIAHVENAKPVKVRFNIDSGEGKKFTKKSRVSKKTGNKL